MEILYSKFVIHGDYKVISNKYLIHGDHEVILGDGANSSDIKVY